MKNTSLLAKKLAAVALMTLTAAPAMAGEKVGYEEILERTLRNSPLYAMESNRNRLALNLQKRAGLHWAPRVYLDARTMNTNDPTGAFMANLNQQELRTTDLSPAALNDPETVRLTDVALGLDLPLYEGGAGTHLRKAMEEKRQASELGLKASRRALKALTANLYAEFLNRKGFLEKLNSLAFDLDRQIKKYRLGRRSNPVGYSGMLGLKAVRNKVESYARQSSARLEGVRQALDELAGGLPEGWEPEEQEADGFAARRLPLPGNGDEFLDPSAKVKAARKAALAEQNIYEAEKGRALPRVGLFGESNWYSGERSSATSRTVGLYVKWDLFNHRNHGAFREAGIKKEISRQNALQAAMEERIDKKKNLRTMKALEETIEYLKKTGDLLAEQSEVSNRLFRSGSINAIQLSGVIDNRVEALRSLADTRSEYYSVRSHLFRLTGNTENN